MKSRIVSVRVDDPERHRDGIMIGERDKLADLRDQVAEQGCPPSTGVGQGSISGKVKARPLPPMGSGRREAISSSSAETRTFALRNRARVRS